MAKKFQEDDIVVYIIVILSILIEIFIDTLKCLISLTLSASTPSPTKRESQFSDTTPTSSGKVKTQRLSPSTKPSSITEGLKKEDGGTNQDTPVLRTVSSPRSKQSKSISSTQKSTKSGTSPTSGSRRRTRTTTSTTPTTTLSSIPNPNHTTAEQNNDHNSDITAWSDHQPTEHLHVLPEPQEEVQEHTVLRTKVSRSKLKA
jgi:hypothetical protein